MDHIISSMRLAFLALPSCYRSVTLASPLRYLRFAIAGARCDNMRLRLGPPRQSTRSDRVTLGRTAVTFPRLHCITVTVSLEIKGNNLPKTSDLY